MPTMSNHGFQWIPMIHDPRISSFIPAKADPAFDVIPLTGIAIMGISNPVRICCCKATIKPTINSHAIHDPCQPSFFSSPCVIATFWHTKDIFSGTGSTGRICAKLKLRYKNHNIACDCGLDFTSASKRRTSKLRGARRLEGNVLRNSTFLKNM